MNSKVLLFFIDGLGIGEKGRNNPLSLSDKLEPLSNFSNLAGSGPLGGILVPTDARLGIEGRPQSASGQTTILTGVNAPRLLGKHKQGFPNQQLKELIRENSLFLQLKQMGIGPNVFANVYTPGFFASEPRWKSATTCAVEAAGLGFRRLADLLGHCGVFHDFTNRSLREKGFDVPVYTPDRAAENLAGISGNHKFTLYEHFITDKIGHAQDYDKAADHLPLLATFIRRTLERIDLQKTTFILTSDHGNIEDLSIRTHTLNPVPTIIWGRKKEKAAEMISDLTDITPAILHLLTK